MASILEISQDVADELSLDVPETLFGQYMNQNGRRLRRSITAVAKFLGADYDWPFLVHDHIFTVVDQQIQPGAKPYDLLRIKDGTMFDMTQRLPLQRAEFANEWNAARTAGIQALPIRWREVGDDVTIQPYAAGNRILYSYVSNAIGRSNPSAPPVSRAESGDILEPFHRYIIPVNANIGIPSLEAGEYIEVLPAIGSWRNLNATFTTSNSNDIINASGIESSDVITISRRALTYDLVSSLGAWVPEIEHSVNGQMLVPGKRYIVDQGQVLYLPVMRAGQSLELTPRTMNWVGLNMRLISREGLAINPLNISIGGGIIRAESIENGYNLVQPQLSSTGLPPKRQISEFTADSDVPLWDKELMILGVVWRLNWRDGQPYNEDFRAFERMIYDRLKGGGTAGVISLNASSSSYADSRMRAMRTMSAVLGQATTWESTI